MIIEMIMSVIYNVFELLTTPIDIPDLPSSLADILGRFYEYIYMGIGVISNYTHYSYLVTLFMLIVAVELGINIYKLVMFILRKIPMLSIK